MKIKKIISLCKAAKQLMIFESPDGQWLSDGGAVYPMFEMPKFDELSICTAYDIKNDVAAKMNIRYLDALPAACDFSDVIENEVKVEEGDVQIIFHGVTMIPIKTSQGLAFIDKRYLEPFGERDSMEIYERQLSSGRVYFAVKNGFMLNGIIMPCDPVNKDFCEKLTSLAEHCEVALFNKEESKDGV